MRFKKVAKIFSVILLIGIASFSFYQYFSIKNDGKNEVGKIAQLVKDVVEEVEVIGDSPNPEDIEASTSSDNSDSQMSKTLENLKALKEKNLLLSNKVLDKLNEEYNTTAISAYLDLGEGSIQEIVAHDTSGNYYDRKNIRGEYDIKGTVFLFYKNKSYLDKYLNLFGHGLKSGVRFGLLPISQPEEINNATLYTREGLFEYELVFLSNIPAIHYSKLPTWTEEGVIEFINRSHKFGNVVYEIENNYEDGDYMLLSTCLHTGRSNRRIAIYKKVEY